MNIRILYLLFSLLFLSFPANGQQAIKGNDILAKTATTLKQTKDIQFVFKGSNEGKLLMKGNKFFLDCAGIKSWFDGKTLWSYIEEAEEVNVSHPTAEELQSINPYLLIQSYNNGNQCLYSQPAKRNGNEGYEIGLVPPKQLNISTVMLFVSKSFIPIYIRIDKGKQESYEFDIISYKMNQFLDDDVFTFDPKKFPHAEIIDLR